MRELPYTHKLKHPVRDGSSENSHEYTELVFNRKPVAGDLRGMSLRELDKADNIILLTSRLTATPPNVISRLDIEDTVELFEVLGDFLSIGRKTGSEPAES